MKNKLSILGTIIGIIGLSLSWVFFGWKLALVLVLVIWGNNLEQRFKN